MKDEKELHVREQGAAAIVNAFNSSRLDSLSIELGLQDVAFQEGIREIEVVRTFIGDPLHILGSDSTKHGEVAEHIEVGIRRAFDALRQRPFSATFDGVGRTAPEDYKIDGQDVQSKFINGARNSLAHIIEHIEKYNYWGKDGQYYHIPKDQFEQIELAYKGMTPDGLSAASAEKLRSKVQEILDRSGQPFDEIIRPGSYEYREVQLGVAPKTLDHEEARVTTEQENLKAEINAQHQPNLGEAAQSAACAGVLAAGLNLGYGIYKKHKDGRSIFELTDSDWKELGLDSAKAGAGGAVTGFAIYGLTNVAGMSAPLAGAITSTARGIYTQIDLYRSGKLSQGSLVDNSMTLGSEAGIVAICAVIGQGAIPIPVLGSILGSIVGKFASQIMKDKLGEDSKALVKQIEDQTNSALAKLDYQYQVVVSRFMAEFDVLENLLALAFDPQSNHRMVEISITIAEKLGVPKAEIIRDEQQLDDFMMS